MDDKYIKELCLEYKRITDDYKNGRMVKSDYKTKIRKIKTKLIEVGNQPEIKDLGFDFSVFFN